MSEFLCNFRLCYGCFQDIYNFWYFSSFDEIAKLKIKGPNWRSGKVHQQNNHTKKIVKTKDLQIRENVAWLFLKSLTFSFHFLFFYQISTILIFKAAKFIKENHLLKDLYSFKHLTLKIRPDENFLQQLKFNPHVL